MSRQPHPAPRHPRADSRDEPRFWRPVPYAIALAFAGAAAHDPGVPPAPASPAEALTDLLQSRGIKATIADVSWIDTPDGTLRGTLRDAQALVRGSVGDEPADLYLVDTRRSPEGVLLDILGMHNLTRTSGVDEGRPMLRGRVAAYLTSLGDTVTGVHMLNLRGSPASDYVDFNRVQRWQAAVTNVQQTGRAAGVVHDAFALDPTARRASIRWTDRGNLAVDADGRHVEIDPERHAAVVGAGWVRAIPEEKARPGNLVTWSVDRVRAAPWFGDTRMQWLKAIVFTALDLALRVRSHVFATSAGDVEDDLGAPIVPATPSALADPEVGWPPAPLVPVITPTLPGEGRWIVLDHDPFITPAPGLPAAFATTFLRTDRDRLDTRVYVTTWDARQIALHMVAGTVEPVSASGEAGPGLIPRVPEVMRRVVAGFNGGFQAIHGEYGMQADGVEYLPPKAYAATILELRDGSTGFGAWPDTTGVPDEVLGFRQNLTAIVQNQKWNPWGRTWWGGTPPGWQDNIHTTRTAVCLTHERAVAYFFGADLSPEALARGMIQARCDFGIHLDMNPGLAGFEFYDVEPEGVFRPLGRPLQSDWEYEGTIRSLPGLRVRARRMTRGMMEVNFPQYIHLEARDFFYLTRRPLLPGAAAPVAIAPPEPDEGVFRVKGLPQHGFPYAIATTSVRPDPAHPEARVRILRIDPKAVRPAASTGTTEQTPTVVSLFAPEQGDSSVYWHEGGFFVGPAPGPAATRVASGVPAGSAPLATLRAMVGIEDLNGTLDWVEFSDPPRDAGLVRSVEALLRNMGCSTSLALVGSGRALLGATADLAGVLTPSPAPPFVRLVRGDVPSARPYFDSTPVVGPGTWQPLQSKRVRYLPKPPKADAGPPTPPSDAGR